MACALDCRVRLALGSRDSIDRFLLEARATAKFSHPNIVTIFSVEEADGTRFITMELLDIVGGAEAVS